MYMPVVEAAKGRAQEVATKVRTQVRMQTGYHGAMSVGNGQLITKAKSKVSGILGTGSTSSQVIVTPPVRKTGAVLNAQQAPRAYVKETIAISQ